MMSTAAACLGMPRNSPLENMIKYLVYKYSLPGEKLEIKNKKYIIGNRFGSIIGDIPPPST